MDARAAAIAQGEAPECVWLLEHPAIYTAGTSADPQELLDAVALSGVRRPAAAGASPIMVPASAWPM